MCVVFPSRAALAIPQGGSSQDKRERLPGKVRKFVAQHPDTLQNLFDKIDRNNDSVISHEEMKASL